MSFDSPEKVLSLTGGVRFTPPVRGESGNTWLQVPPPIGGSAAVMRPRCESAAPWVGLSQWSGQADRPVRSGGYSGQVSPGVNGVNGCRVASRVRLLNGLIPYVGVGLLGS